MTAPHLDDDTLSALLDGDAATEDRAHLATCSACQAELAALSAVARAVGTPVAPSASAEVDAAVARALGSWDDAVPAAPVGGAPPVARTAPGAETAVAGTRPGRGMGIPGPGAPRPMSSGDPRRRRRSGRGGLVVGVGAGAVAAAVLLVILLGRLGHSPSINTVSAPAHHSVVGGSQAPTTSIAPSAPAPTDLGEQSDATAVARAITAVLSLPSTTPAPTTQAPLAASVNGAPTSEPTFSTGGIGSGCDSPAQVALRLPGPETVVYQATLRWRGQPAVAVVFAGPAGRSGAVMSTPTCSLLAVLAF